MSENRPKLDGREEAGGDLDWDVDSLVEQIWADLAGQVSRLAIRHKIADVVPAFQDARITTYVPIFVRRRAVEQLRAGLSGITAKG